MRGFNIDFKVWVDTCYYKFRRFKSMIIKVIHLNPMDLKYIPKWLVSIFKWYSLIEKQIPWIPFKAKKWLNVNLKPQMVVFEYGSGGSTFFFSKRVKQITSIEHNKNYFNFIKKKIEKNNFININNYLIEEMEQYVNYINKFPDHYFDLVYVDGKYRNQCIKESIKKIKAGGYLMLDNSELKKYRNGVELLKRYERTDFIGMGPTVFHIWQNSIWRFK